MQIPDLWSLLTGVASLVSLFLSLGDKFAAWRKYMLPTATALGGFAFGRISPSLSSGVDHLFQDSTASGFLLLFFLILSAITFIAYLLMRHGQVGLAYFVFLFGLGSIPAAVMPMYSKAIDSVPAGDYIKLAQLKVTAGEYEQAIKYLEVAKDKTKSNELKSELQTQVATIEKQAARIQVNPGAKNRE